MVAKHCRETVAEEVRDKQHANFCDYFVLNEQAYQLQPITSANMNALTELFGDKPPTDSADDARKALERLFKK